MSVVAIIHGVEHASTGEAIRRELEQCLIPCWFGPRDAVAGTIDEQRGAIAGAHAVVVVFSPRGPQATAVDEALGAGQAGRRVIPIVAGAERELSLGGSFVSTVAAARAAALSRALHQEIPPPSFSAPSSREPRREALVERRDESAARFVEGRRRPAHLAAISVLVAVALALVALGVLFRQKISMPTMSWLPSVGISLPLVDR